MCAYLHDLSVKFYTQCCINCIFGTIYKLNFNSYTYLVGATMPKRKHPVETSESTTAKRKPQS